MINSKNDSSSKLGLSQASQRDANPPLRGAKGGVGASAKPTRHRNKILPYRKDLKQKARELRKNSTLSEVLLWQEIKNRALGCQFHRQVPIDNYIVDFYCHELLLAIEIDGESHDHEDAVPYDEQRQQRLESLGVRVIHFDDLDLKKDMGMVMEVLEEKVEELEQRA